MHACFLCCFFFFFFIVEKVYFSIKIALWHKFCNSKYSYYLVSFGEFIFVLVFLVKCIFSNGQKPKMQNRSCAGPRGFVSSDDFVNLLQFSLAFCLKRRKFGTVTVFPEEFPKTGVLFLVSAFLVFSPPPRR